MRTSCIPKTGAHAAVLVWPDIFGLRDPFRQMGKRLAEYGYSVLTVNPFYRTQKAPTAPPNPNFQDPATREALFKLAGTLNATTHVTDAKAFVTWLDAQQAGRQEEEDRHRGLLHGRPDRDAHGRGRVPIASAPAPRSMAADSPPRTRTARTCSSRR